MKLLLDTHVLLWWLADDQRLRERTAATIVSGDNEILVSAASVWEIEIKRAKGALSAPDDLLDQIVACGFGLLAIDGRHAHAAGRLPQHHHDPFDRMLVAQATVEAAALVTADSTLSAYGVALLDAG
jgi:PIN domain nuclease of toxin-antitoxin system